MDDGDEKHLQRQLAVACQQGDYETVHQILEDDSFTEGIDTDVGEGSTLLHLAAAGGHENVVRLLLMRGAMLNSTNLYGWTPLMQAASYGHAHIVALLLQNKIDFNAKNKLGASALTLAALGGHLAVTRMLLDHPGIDLNDCQSLGQSLTPVMAAAACGYKSILKLLLERGSVQSYLERSTGWTTLMMASLGGSHGAAEMLLRNGADPNATDINQKTALEVAMVQDGNKVRELLDAKTTNKMGVAGMERSRIFKATEAGDEDIVKQLLTEDPSRCNIASKEGATPLMIAAMLGHRVIAEILVKKGAKIDYQEGRTGWTALMQATFHRHLEVVKYLLEAGADTFIQAADGSTALDLALVIINSETDHAGDELICLLASRDRLEQNGLMNGGMHRLMNDGPSQRVTSEEDFLNGGLKAWWSRMSNRFQNLKLTRTLRAGFVSSKVSSVGDETLDKTLCLEHDISSHIVSIRSSQKRNKSVGFNLGCDTQTTSIGETHSSLSMTLQPASFVQADSQMPTVIPPFLPTPAFEFNKTDRHKRNSIKTMRRSISTQRSSEIPRKHIAPNRLLFTRRLGATQTSHSLHTEETIGASPTGDSDLVKNGKIISGTRHRVTRSGAPGSAKKEAWMATSGERPSDELARYQELTASRLGSASSTSSTLSGSTKNPARHNVRRTNPKGTAASSNSTLTPPTSPIVEDNSHPPNKGKRNSHAARSAVTPSSQDSSRNPDDLAVLLERLSLSRYKDTFEEQEVDMDTFLTLSEPDLEEMGIAASGDRHQLIKAIREQKASENAKEPNNR